MCEASLINKIQQLDKITKDIFLAWSTMEIKHANIINLNRVEDKAFLTELIADWILPRP